MWYSGWSLERVGSPLCLKGNNCAKLERCCMITVAGGSAG